jgi:hypothetical protein
MTGVPVTGKEGPRPPGINNWTLDRLGRELEKTVTCLYWTGSQRQSIGCCAGHARYLGTYQSNFAPIVSLVEWAVFCLS